MASRFKDSYTAVSCDLIIKKSQMDAILGFTANMQIKFYNIHINNPVLHKYEYTAVS